ncbi:Lcl domain-containing protein, partial [Candidatus Venteria ishoeyi]|uniref:Lcl domain-containing protein n=1 Tax=Candidatus Venteria ishoeyi TaxID=1899563 RepID=UPI000CDEE587
MMQKLWYSQFSESLFRFSAWLRGSGCSLAVAWLILSSGVYAQTCLEGVEPTTPTAEFSIHNDGTVSHQRTQLMWDRCAWGQSGENCDQGSAGEYTWEEAQQQADIANGQGYKGYTDWRLPTKRELASIVEYQCGDPAINETVFPATLSYYFWSSSPLAYGSNYAWYVGFNNGGVNTYNKDNAWRVRLVRGGQAFDFLPDEPQQSCNGGVTTLNNGEYRIHDNGTATHHLTKLIWDRCDWGESGTNCENGDATYYYWNEAQGQVRIANQQNYKGHDDWRLPTAYELGSISEEACSNPALNTTVFPRTSSSGFWSSSPYANVSSNAWYVPFYNGHVNVNYGSNTLRVRLVRGGQSSDFLPANQSPTASFSLSTTTGQAPLSVTLNASNSNDPDGDTLSYTWDSNGVPFGNGAVNFNHTFTPGNRTISLTVTDPAGLSHSSSQSLQVSLPPAPQLASLEMILTLNESQTLTAQSQAVPLSWRSVNDLVASVDTAGTVTATGIGNTALIVTDAYGQNTTMTMQVVVPVDTPITIGQAIIIAAGGAHPNNTLFRYSNDFTQRMYRLLRMRGYSDEDIIYLNPHAPDILPVDGYLEADKQDFDLFDPQTEIEQAFAQARLRLQAGQQFVLYVHGHARVGHLDIRPPYELSAQQLRQQLDSLPADVEQIIILDTCF